MVTNRIMILMGLFGPILFVALYTDRYLARAATPPQIGLIATEASANIGSVGQTADGAAPPAVFVLEETHSSRASLIQHAISLVRLHDKYGLKDIILEGYLQERPEVSALWFRTKARDPVVRARTAVRLLKEGEISAPEFMFLVYDDLKLYPAEKASEYNVNFKPGAVDALEKLWARLDSPERQGVIKEKLDAAMQGRAVPAEEQLAIALELDAVRRKKSIALPTAQLAAWNSWIGFWRGRANGNSTMMDALERAAASSHASLIAMNVGAAHTVGICSLLAKAGHPYAVLTPIALKNHDTRGDLSESYERKANRLSVLTKGYFASQVVRRFSGKKPEPVLNQRWFQAKGLIYLQVANIAEALIPSNGPPNNRPPYGFSAGEFDNAFFSINPGQIQYVSDDPTKDNQDAVLFPMLLKGTSGRSTVWVKAALGPASERNAKAILDMLRRALEEAQQETEAPTGTEDDRSRIMVSTGVVATFSATREAAKRTILANS